MAASMNNVSDVYTTDFPSPPPVEFNYTGDVPNTLWAQISGTKVKVIEYNSSGEGFGNYNESDHDPFNLVDPPQRNTVGVPVNGWVAIRFKADNPGNKQSAWFVHCHFDDHVTWGLVTVSLVKDGTRASESLIPPDDLPKC
ncbi:hypothetical protein SUGI_0962020 [Cryptomeria japonica]|nr:hypothetical protein SUGI_0962020 [Cryptomeria japonica]